ncbi:MAG: CPBP family intramembrane metalloprotease [Oscillospiraceae bacterium]|nr:CPBP family intramembrane metalloprotease [Oscillospiraceae bacterium]
MKAKQGRLWGILATSAVGLIELAGVVRLWQKVQRGAVVSVRLASSQPAAFLFQCLREFLFPAILLILFALALKKDFAAGMCLRLRGKWQRAAAAALAAAILGLTAYGLAVKADKLAILISLVYYLIVIAFAEEFVFRGACAYFLREASWPLRYLLPNAFFALLHLFVSAGWGAIDGGALLRFLFDGTFLGYVFGGCMFQLLKERSGTLWLPVLLHGLMDYTSILLY